MTLNTRIELALHNPHLQRALDANYTRSQEKRNISMGALPDSDLVRDRARAIRLEALRNLDQYLVQLETQVTERGGVVHWAANAQDAGIKLVLKAVESPLREIVYNAGGEPSVVVNAVLAGKGNYGFNAANDTYGDMIEMGILDPTKVTRTALQNAASVASLMLTTEAMIAEAPKDDAGPMGGMGGGDMGGMGGMGGMGM